MGTYSTSPPNSQEDFIDSHYQWVKQRVIAINANRQFGGIVPARDWPLQQAIPQAFYLAVGKKTPGRNSSWQSRMYSISLMWSWVVMGSDLTQGEQASNRGDKYRTNEQIQQELLNGVYPGFCQKQMYSVADNGQGQPVLQATPFLGSEYVWWGPPTFNEKIDKNTGILFGYGSLAISGFAPEINS